MPGECETAQAALEVGDAKNETMRVGFWCAVLAQPLCTPGLDCA
jgi:hypothetical protein